VPRWLDRLIDKQRGGVGAQTKPVALQTEQRGWLVRPLGPIDAAEPGTPLQITARSDVRVGHRCLVVTGSKVVAVGVVLGENVAKRRAQAVRTLLVTHRLPQPFEMTRSLGGARAAPTTREEWEAVRTPDLDGWDFVLEASEGLDSSSRRVSPKTLEKHAEEFLLKVLGGADLQARGQVLLPNTEDPDALRPRPLRADVVVTWSDDSGPHALVVEGEWTQPGGAQSAAQAYEYARHLKTPMDGEAPDGFGAFPFREASIHAVVVANRRPKTCMTADALGVRRFDYADFIALVGRKQLGQLPMIVVDGP
jgi:hypothetical protein